MNNLFDNPMVREAEKALTKEQKERYKALGESMFKDIDFEECSVNNAPPFMTEGVQRIESLIRSGFHISLLSDEEKILMAEVKGSKWYSLYGFQEEDLTDVVNIYCQSSL